MSTDAAMSEHEADEFAQSVAGVLDRVRPAEAEWAPGVVGATPGGWPGLRAQLHDLGWDSLSTDSELAGFTGPAAVSLGRRLAPLSEIDRLLGGAPAHGDLVRCLWEGAPALVCAGQTAVRRAVLRAQPCPSAEGLDVHRLESLGDSVPADLAPAAPAAWRAAGVGYLAGLGEGALQMTVEYVRQRRAFGGTLGDLAPVQQLLASAATAVRGVRLLAGAAPDADALAHCGPAIAEACAACQQVTGAIGYTLEYPLHRYTQRARALAIWNDALLAQPPLAG